MAEDQATEGVPSRSGSPLPSFSSPKGKSGTVAMTNRCSHSGTHVVQKQHCKGHGRWYVLLYMVRSVTYIPTLEYVGIMYLVLSILLYVQLLASQVISHIALPCVACSQGVIEWAVLTGYFQFCTHSNHIKMVQWECCISQFPLPGHWKSSRGNCLCLAW